MEVSRLALVLLSYIWCFYSVVGDVNGIRRVKLIIPKGSLLWTLPDL